MVALSRIEELRRRIQKDPASIAFAQLAEEYRRAGRFAEAIETCRTGLAYHPGYLSAHVTLGRALAETGDLQGAEDALSRVHAAAPDNLAALKGLADVHLRRGERQQALGLYRRALSLAPQDADLEHLVAEVGGDTAERRSAPADRPAPAIDPPALPSNPEAPRTAEQVAVLERWLDVIVADRDSRK